MGGVDYDSPSPAFEKKNELSMQFDRSISLVRNYTERIERDYAKPLLKICYDYSQRRPISAVFIGFFVFLSFLPIISFVGISVFSTVVLTTTALVAAFITSAAIVLGLLAVLLAILTAAFFASICLSLMAISAYLSFRLYILVRKEGTSGISYWTIEIKELVMGTRSHTVRQNGVKGVLETPVAAQEDTESDYTSDSETHVQERDKEIPAKVEEYDDCAVKEQGTLITDSPDSNRVPISI